MHNNVKFSIYIRAYKLSVSEDGFKLNDNDIDLI